MPHDPEHFGNCRVERGWGLFCFVTKNPIPLNSKTLGLCISGNVKSIEAGQRIVEMFRGHARVILRQGQIKVHAAVVPALEHVVERFVLHIHNAQHWISHSIVEQFIQEGKKELKNTTSHVKINYLPRKAAIKEQNSTRPLMLTGSLGQKTEESPHIPAQTASTSMKKETILSL